MVEIIVMNMMTKETMAINDDEDNNSDRKKDENNNREKVYRSG